MVTGSTKTANKPLASIKMPLMHSPRLRLPRSPGEFFEIITRRFFRAPRIALESITLGACTSRSSRTDVAENWMMDAAVAVAVAVVAVVAMVE